MVALPVFFAAMIFATAFRGRTDASRALAFNVMGAVVGGVLEYSSMLVGIKALYIVGAVTYLGAWYAMRAEVKPAAEGAAVPDTAPVTSTA